MPLKTWIGTLKRLKLLSHDLQASKGNHSKRNCGNSIISGSVKVMSEEWTADKESLLRQLRREKAKHIRDKKRKRKYSPRLQK